MTTTTDVTDHPALILESRLREALAMARINTKMTLAALHGSNGFMSEPEALEHAATTAVRLEDICAQALEQDYPAFRKHMAKPA